MADFRQYSEKYPFRQRSETPEIAIELSLQPWRSFGVDGVIMFSDILTPLPALGLDFTIIEKKGMISWLHESILFNHTCFHTFAFPIHT